MLYSTERSVEKLVWETESVIVLDSNAISVKGLLLFVLVYVCVCIICFVMAPKDCVEFTSSSASSLPSASLH